MATQSHREPATDRTTDRMSDRTSGRSPGKPTAQSQARSRAESILQALRDAGGRVTVPRRAVLDALLSGGDHPTPDDLAKRVQLVHPDVAVSTVYRTLEQLEDIGVIVHVHLGHGPAVYHFAEDSHLHLVCRICGHAVALSAPATRSLVKTIRNASGFEADLAHFSITGLCGPCAEGHDPHP